jgi:hypothetical protein
MNQTNIPPVNQANRPLVSVGNGNQVKWGDFPVTQQVANTGGGSTLPTGTGTGQMIWWNGTSWVVTTTPTTGSYLYWNGTTWTNATAGDATKIQGYSVNITGIGNGDLLYWSNVGSTQQWLTGPTPTGDGQLQYWNTALGGHWSLSAAATSTGQALVWNNSTLTWGPANITLAGDVTGSAGANTVVKIQNYPVSMAGVGNGDVLYWSNVGTTQWVTGPTPTINGQTLIWNSSTSSWNVGIPSASGTAGGDLSGTYPNPTVIKLQNYPVNVTGLSGSGGFMYYTSTGSQFVFSGTPTGTGSIMYWNGSGYVSTSAPSSTGVLQWNSGSSTYSYVAVGGSTPNNDAWSANPQTTAQAIPYNGTAPYVQAVNSVAFNNGSYTFSKFLVTWSAAQSNAASGTSNLTVNIVETGGILVGLYTVGQVLTTTRNTFSGSFVYTQATPASSTMTLQFSWQSNITGQLNWSNLSVVGIS